MIRFFSSVKVSIKRLLQSRKISADFFRMVSLQKTLGSQKDTCQKYWFILSFNLFFPRIGDQILLSRWNSKSSYWWEPMPLKIFRLGSFHLYFGVPMVPKRKEVHRNFLPSFFPSRSRSKVFLIVVIYSSEKTTDLVHCMRSLSVQNSKDCLHFWFVAKINSLVCITTGFSYFIRASIENVLHVVNSSVEFFEFIFAC